MRPSFCLRGCSMSWQFCILVKRLYYTNQDTNCRMHLTLQIRYISTNWWTVQGCAKRIAQRCRERIVWRKWRLEIPPLLLLPPPQVRKFSLYLIFRTFDGRTFWHLLTYLLHSFEVAVCPSVSLREGERRKTPFPSRCRRLSLVLSLLRRRYRGIYSASHDCITDWG